MFGYKGLLLVLCLFPVAIWSLIVESSKMSDLEKYVEAKTYVLIDVDNTLIQSSTHLGSVAWRSHIRKKALKAGYDAEEAELFLDKSWLFVQPLIQVELVDKETRDVLSRLKDAHIVVVALTAREPIEEGHTFRQLRSVGIDLSNAVFPQRLVLSTPYPALYQDGVIYCGENTKPEALLAFFKETGGAPKKVLIADDRIEQVEALEKAMQLLGIPFIGLRFAGADARVKSFDPEAADKQWSLLPKIVSDEEIRCSR